MWHALLLEAVDDEGGYAGIDRGLDRSGVGLIDKYRDRPLDRAAHLEHLIQEVAAGAGEIDQDDVRTKLGDAGEQVAGIVDLREIDVAARAQPVFDNCGARRAMLDDG